MDFTWTCTISLQCQPGEQGAHEGRVREEVSGASMNAFESPLGPHEKVASSSRAELEEVVMSMERQRNHIVFIETAAGRPPQGPFAVCK